MKDKVLYGVITFLLSFIVYQFNNRNSLSVVETKTDTLVVYQTVRDTVRLKPRIIYSEPDTVWLTVVEHAPDTNYQRLLAQYRKLGDMHFKLNVFENRFKIGEFGTGVVTDTIAANQVIGSNVMLDFYLPEKRVIIREPLPPASYFYLGPRVTASTRSLGLHVGALYKTKNERIFSASVGWDGVMQYGAGYYWKLKL